MLAAWLRMKYPQWFQGALSSSGPVLFFDGWVSPYAYYDLCTEDFRKYDIDCPVMIKEGFDLLGKLADQPESYGSIAEIFGLCTVPTSSAEI